MIRFACPSCDKTLGIDDRFAGRRIACPQCKSELTVPSSRAPGAKDDKGRSEAYFAEDDGRVRLKKSLSEDDGLDMTPMVDVTFLLLIFFMITASFQLQKSMQASPPDLDQQAAAAAVIPEEPKDEPIVIEITFDDNIYVDGELTLPGEVERKLSELRVTQQVEEVTIEADRQARHGTVISVSDSAIRAGYASIKRKSVGE